MPIPPAPHPALDFRDCQQRWGRHGCNREGSHQQHLCPCGKWLRNTNPDHASTRYGTLPRRTNEQGQQES